MLMKWPDKEAAVMRHEYPCNPPTCWYEDRKWPKGWGVLGDLRGQKVLDVGCHTGWLGWLAKECGAEVWATDIFATAVHPSLSFLVAMTEELPFGSKTFDQVITANTLHHVQNLDLALREIARVLKPGGTFTSFQEPSIPLTVTEAEAQQENECAREIAKGINERRYTAAEWKKALERRFSSTEVWLCHGNPLLPKEHNWDLITWDTLGDYYGGIGVRCVK